MLLVFAEEELIGHARDVIANDDIARFREDRFFVRRGHGAGRIEVVQEKFLEAAEGTVAVFGDGRMIVDVLEEETLHLRVSLRERVTETGESLRGTANVLHGSGSGSEHALLRGLNEISGEAIQHESKSCIELELLPSSGISSVYLCIGLGENRDFITQSVEIEKFCLPRVVEVSRVVSNFVDPIDELALERRAKFEKILGKMGQLRGGVVVGVLDDALANFKAEIQAGKIKIGTLKLFDDAQRLEIVIEARAVSAHQLVERAFSGVAKGGMADIVNERECFGEFRIEAQSGGNRAGDLRNFESMREAIAKVVGVTDGEDLSLGFEAAESAGMNDAVAIACIHAAIGMRRFRIAAAAREFGAHRPRRACRVQFDERLRQWDLLPNAFLRRFKSS